MRLNNAFRNELPEVFKFTLFTKFHVFIENIYFVEFYKDFKITLNGGPNVFIENEFSKYNGTFWKNQQNYTQKTYSKKQFGHSNLVFPSRGIYLT